MINPAPCSLLIPLLFTAPVPATDGWERFRGPNGTGVCETEELPLDLNPDKALWRTEVPPGYSSPVLTEKTVYVTGNEGKKLFTLCIDRFEGEILWQVEAPQELDEVPRGPNSPAAATPATDGKNVYVFFEGSGIVSYDEAGKLRWSTHLGSFHNPYGMGNSPILVDDLVVFQADQDVGSFLIALDQSSGKVRWRTDRPGSTHSFSTPVIWRPAEGPAHIIVSGAYEVVGFSAATGEREWWVSGMAWQAKSVPVVHEDMLYVHTWMESPTELGVPKISMTFEEALEVHDADGDGKISKSEAPDKGMLGLWFLFDTDDDEVLGAEDWRYLLARGAARNGLFAIQLGGSGDLTESAVKWRYRRSLPNIPSPLLYDGVLYMLKESGIFTALNPADGSVLKDGRIEGALDAYYASPIAGAGHLITASHPGHVAVLAAGSEWEVLQVVDFGEEIWATPALADGQLILRTQKALYGFEPQP